jgi:crossover junction endodeoxyribonuclease RusA
VTAIAFTVHGVAAPAGSKRALPLGGKPGGRPIIVDDSKRSRPWKRDVAKTAAAAMAGRQLLDGPLELQVRFYVPRPKGHFGTGRNAGVVKASAPEFPTVKPDVTKLLRAVEDAMTGVIYRDDAQVVKQVAVKLYGEPARCVVAVAQIAAQGRLA